MRLVQDEPVFSREEIIWAAGLFDGEGSTFTKSGNNKAYRYPVLSVTNTDAELLRRFQNAMLGLGSIAGPYNYNPHHKPKYIYRISGIEKVQAAVVMLWQFLSTQKRSQYIRTCTRIATKK